MSAGFRFCPRCAQPLRLRADTGAARLGCSDPACGYTHWDNPVPVVAAIVEHEGGVILAHNALWPAGMFGLITGFLERADPSPESGVLREVEEELGLRGELGGFVGHYPFARQNQLIIAFHVRAQGPIRLSEELTAYRRYAPETIRPWAAATGHALRDWLVGRGLDPPSERTIIEGIRGFHRLDERLAGAGQPDVDQILTLRAGFDSVINLAPDGHAQALPGEAALLRLIGHSYHHVPVAFDAPQDADFDRFCAAMDAEAGQRVLVHCIANKRASSFLYLYRRLRGEVPAAQALAERAAVWRPDAVWSAFEARQLQRAGQA